MGCSAEAITAGDQEQSVSSTLTRHLLKENVRTADEAKRNFHILLLKKKNIIRKRKQQEGKRVQQKTWNQVWPEPAAVWQYRRRASRRRTSGARSSMVTRVTNQKGWFLSPQKSQHT